MADTWTLLEFHEPTPLCLNSTFQNGQCFGWKNTSESAGDHDEGQQFTGVIGHRVVTVRRRTVHAPTALAAEAAAGNGTIVEFQVSSGTGASDSSALIGAVNEEMARSLQDVLQLDRDMCALRSGWEASDKRMKRVAPCIPGMRVLRQDPVECLFSFICSSNNNIARITGILERLRRAYGTHLGAAHGHEWYSFPSVASLAAATEKELKALGLGYRAKFIRGSAAMLLDNGDAWLPELRNKSFAAVREALITLPGVGPKVADCVAVFSLDQRDCIPVDTHVWAIACRDYDPSLVECRSLTPAVYKRVGDLFRARFGAEAGWAHSLLFAAELPMFRDYLPADVLADMDAFRAQEKEAKKQATTRKRLAKKAASQAAAGAGVAAGPGAGTEGGAASGTADVKSESPIRQARTAGDSGMQSAGRPKRARRSGI